MATGKMVVMAGAVAVGCEPQWSMLFRAFSWCNFVRDEGNKCTQQNFACNVTAVESQSLWRESQQSYFHNLSIWSILTDLVVCTDNAAAMYMTRKLLTYLVQNVRMFSHLSVPLSFFLIFFNCVENGMLWKVCTWYSCQTGQCHEF
jgi:hypothetical protein